MHEIVEKKYLNEHSLFLMRAENSEGVGQYREVFYGKLRNMYDWNFKNILLKEITNCLSNLGKKNKQLKAHLHIYIHKRLGVTRFTTWL